MLPKRHRLRAADFNRLRSARVIHSPHFLARVVRRRADEAAKAAVVVSAKTARTAAERTLLRRRVYAALDPRVRSGAGFFLTVTAKAGAGALSFRELTGELTALLEKGGVLDTFQIPSAPPANRRAGTSQTNSKS